MRSTPRCDPCRPRKRAAIDAIIGDHAKCLADADPERLIALVEDQLATVDLSDPEGGLHLLWGLTGRRPRLSSVTREELLCDAAITPIAFDGRDAVGVADTTSVFPDKVRIAIIARDQRCRFCSRAPASWCDVHPGTGNTARDGCLLCRRCHRTVHRYRWSGEWLDEGTIRFRRRGKHFDSIPP